MRRDNSKWFTRILAKRVDNQTNDNYSRKDWKREMSEENGSRNVLTSIPAIMGIKNHGNTCFMNAVLQCLSNTDLLAEYLVMNQYKIDLLRHNKTHAKKYGTRGEVTEQLANLFKSLWSNQYTAEISNKFKLLVAKYGPQYEGNNQHDAQEFLLWLLDKVHEDLNIATKKKYKKFKNLNNLHRPDEILAVETLQNHMRCNMSYIHDLFQAQLRSSLVCRSCGKHSNTFDPYLCLSLPVPTRQTHTIVINVTYLRKIPKEVKIAVSIESQGTLRELRDKVSRMIKVPEKQLVLLLIDQEFGIKELSKDTDIINEILGDMQEIQAIETSQMQQPVISVHQVDSSSSIENDSPSGQMLILVWGNRMGIGNQKNIFGPLFSSQVLRESSFKVLQTEIIKTMKPILKKSVDPNSATDSIVLRLRVVDGIPGKCYISDDVDHPLYMPTIDKALQGCEEKDYRGPVHLKLIVEWDLELRQNLLLELEDMPTPVLDNNIEYVKARTQKANRASLQDCFDMYFREEKLAAENAWMCPACKRRQQCVKKLSMWSVPDVFIVHLKRFRQASSTQRTKLTTLVLFPLTDLDMNSYLAPRITKVHNNTSTLNNYTNNDIKGQSSSTSVNSNGSPSYNIPNGRVNSPPSSLPAIWSPWQRPANYSKMGLKIEDNLYDLYAVCNHHGNMQGGHYTAYCKNPIDSRWYSFDDTKVTPLPEASVVTADAYILFYQRSSLSSAMSCASSSTSGYSSCASSYFSIEHQHHWAFRMPPFPPWSPKSSRSQDNINDTFQLNGLVTNNNNSNAIITRNENNPIPPNTITPAIKGSSIKCNGNDRLYATLPSRSQPNKQIPVQQLSSHTTKDSNLVYNNSVSNNIKTLPPKTTNKTSKIPISSNKNSQEKSEQHSGSCDEQLTANSSSIVSAVTDVTIKENLISSSTAPIANSSLSTSPPNTLPTDFQNNSKDLNKKYWTVTSV